MSGRPEIPYPLDHPIAVGRTAELFAWGDGRVIKLTRPDFPPYLADQEWRNALAAWQLGVPSPKPFELLEVNGRRGVVFERIQGPNLIQSLQRNPFQSRGLRPPSRPPAGSLARHSRRAMFPSQQERIQRNLETSTFLPADLKKRLLQRLAALPDGDKLCHGDFHPENIILAAQGPLIIDWEGCMRGNPSADVAVTRLWMRYAVTFGAGAAGWLLRQAGRLFERAYLAEYNRVAPAPADHQEVWIALVLAARLPEYNPRAIPRLAPLIEAGLHS